MRRAISLNTSSVCCTGTATSTKSASFTAARVSLGDLVDDPQRERALQVAPAAADADDPC